jgi:hypothetical protein
VYRSFWIADAHRIGPCDRGGEEENEEKAQDQSVTWLHLERIDIASALGVPSLTNHFRLLEHFASTFTGWVSIEQRVKALAKTKASWVAVFTALT